MKKIAIYPGTFDPITYGHIDVIRKSLSLVDNLIIGVSNSLNKKYLFNADERIEIIKNALFKDLRFSKKKLKVITFNNLTTSLCKNITQD